MKQGLHEVSAIQNYPIGFGLTKGEREFVYCKVGDCSGTADLWVEGKGQPCEYGCGMSTMVTTSTFTGTNIKAGVEGGKTVKVVLADTEVDDYAGGYFGLHSATGGTTWGARIISNSATDSDGNVTFILEDVLPVALTTSDTVSITPNPYSNVSQHSGPDAFSAVIGVCLNYAAAPGADLEGKYVWIQTDGPLPEPQIHTAHQGDGNQERMLYWASPRAMQCPTADPLAQQVAGFYLPCGDKTNTFDHPVVWLKGG